jgi:hypothetical protein
MVASEADLKSHGLAKRDTGTSAMRTSELPLSPVHSFSVLSAIVGSAIIMLLAATAVYFLAHSRTKAARVITVAPQLQDNIRRRGLN